MPKIAEFFGISIYIYYDDHPPPHFHALYSGEEAVIRIGDLSVRDGSLPPRALGLVMEWAALHREELAAAWASAEALEVLPQIAPLE
jgi:hypothetical protein